MQKPWIMWTLPYAHVCEDTQRKLAEALRIEVESGGIPMMSTLTTLVPKTVSLRSDGNIQVHVVYMHEALGEGVSAGHITFYYDHLNAEYQVVEYQGVK